MLALFRARLSPAWPLLAASLYCLGCTTTLDPTTWAASADETLGGATGEPEPEPDTPPAAVGCPEEDGMGGRTFSDCTDLLPCTKLGEKDSHLICEHTLSYDAASYECRLRGGRLVEMNSEAENLMIAEAARQMVGTNVWLGGRRSETFVWAWEHSQTVFWQGDRAGTSVEGVFVNWQPGEPNNTSTVSDEPEKCLALTSTDADWNDRACSVTLPFVCEID